MENEDTKVVAPETDTGDTTNNDEVLTVPKAEYEKLNQTLGSLKRELKDLKKPKEDTPKDSPKPDINLMQKAFLRTAGIVDADEVEEALKTAEKWGIEVDALVDDDDWKVKLDKIRTTKANTEATSDLRGSGNQSTAKNDPAYWIAKGTPPTPEQVPDRKIRSKIVRAFLSSAKDGKKFYND